MDISVVGDWGVIDGATLKLRKRLVDDLKTETDMVGNRLKFRPSRHALTFLAHTPKAKFAPNCRTAWGHHFKNRPATNDAFKFKTEPYEHQIEVFKTIKDRTYYALEWEMGLGKTKTALDVSAYKYLSNMIDMVLVVTDKGVHENWVDREIPTHLALDKKRYKAASWHTGRVEGNMRGIVEFEGLAIATINWSVIDRKRGKEFISRALANRRVLIIVDESDNMATPTSSQTKAMLRYAKLAAARLIMTGTPILNSPLDSWAPFQFLNPEIMGDRKFGAFKRGYSVLEPLFGVTHMAWRPDPQTGKMVQVEEPVRVVTGYKNIPDLKRRIDPHRSRLLKEDCLDLPEKVYSRHGFELPDEYKKAYRSLSRDLVLELGDDERVTAPLALTKIIRLQQLCCGFVVPEGTAGGASDLFGKPFTAVNPRMDALAEVCRQAQGKAIIWAPWRYSINEIRAYLEDKYGKETVVVYAGETSPANRKIAIDTFQDPDSGVRWFVSQQQAGGRGITLTQARNVIYYANTYSYGLRVQSEDRAHRIGQHFPVNYVDIEALNTIDATIIQALLDKLEIASMITGDRLKLWLTN